MSPRKPRKLPPIPTHMGLLRTIPEFPLQALPSEPRARFEAVWTLYDPNVRRERRNELDRAFRALWDDYMKLALRMAAPRTKYTWVTAVEKVPNGEDLEETSNVQAAEIVSCYTEWEDALSAELDGLAGELKPQPGQEWMLAHSVWESTYSTQGFGAAHYAEKKAEGVAKDYQKQGLETKIEKKGRDYEVHVRAHPVDIEIAKRRPGLSMKEWLQWCRSAGVNPRVYLPRLPHGVEEALGLR